MQHHFFIRLSGILLAALISHAVTAAPLQPAQVQSLLPVVAKVLLQRASTTGLLDYCASRNVSLKAQTEQARKLWLQRNKAIMTKADVLRLRLWLSLKQEQSGLKAETTILNIDQLVQQSVQKKIHALGNYNPEQQHLICQQLIKAVQAGDWDISKQLSRTYSILENFH